MRYIVLGKTELKEELFNTDLTDNGINKPKGGLWSSPYNKDTISGWYQFCKEENFIKDYCHQHSLICEVYHLPTMTGNFEAQAHQARYHFSLKLFYSI